MTTHANAELFSAYLDRELAPARARWVEEHVADCDRCRQELEDLSRLVGRLRELDRLAPPSVLELAVQRRVALEVREPSLLQRLEKRLERVAIEPRVNVTFALVFAFAVILYVFANGLDRYRQRGIPVLLAPTGVEAPVAPVEPSTVGSELTAVEWRDGAWQAAPRPQGAVSRVRVGSQEWTRVLELHPELGRLDLTAGAPILVRLGETGLEIVPGGEE